MPFDNYFIVDIETVPIKLDAYESLPEEERKKLINPIDSKIIMIGLRHNGADRIFSEGGEKRILEDFWAEWRRIKQATGQFVFVVGFNLLSFDLPFITTRSFIHNVKIVPFVLKNIVDLRDKLSAHRYGRTRGTLKEFGALMGLGEAEMDGSQVAELYKKGELQKLVEYLKNDLKVTDEMFKRARELGILEIQKW